MKKHSLGKSWSIQGTIEAATEPYIVSSDRNTITLWRRRDGARVTQATVEKGLIGVTVAELELMSGLQQKLPSPFCQLAQSVKADSQGKHIDLDG